MADRLSIAEYARGRRALLLLSVGLTGCGIGIWVAAVPSPHGYIELLVALPLVCVGLIATALPVVIGKRRPPVGLVWLAWIILFAAAAPLVGLLFTLVVAL